MTPDEVKKYLPVWTGQHREFGESISRDILVKKKPHFQWLFTDYCHETHTDQWNRITYRYLCQMYHLQLCVLFKNHYWCALNGADVAGSKIVIAFHGKLQFSDMRKCSQNSESEQYHLCTWKSLETVKCLAKERTPSPQPGPSQMTTPHKPSIPPKLKPAGPKKPIKVEPGTTPKPGKLTLQVTTHGVPNSTKSVFIQMSCGMQNN